jgi:hypothetical protein
VDRFPLPLYLTYIEEITLDKQNVNLSGEFILLVRNKVMGET